MTSTSEPPTVEQKPHLEAGNAGGLVAEALGKPDGKPGGYTATMDIDQINDEKSKAGEKVGVDVKKAGSDDGALNSTKVDEKTKEDGGMEKEKQKKEDGNEDDKEPQDPKTMPVREYLETTVVQVMMQGMQQLVRLRPEDPVAWMADFMHRNNPKKRKTEEEEEEKNQRKEQKTDGVNEDDGEAPKDNGEAPKTA